MAHKTSIKCLNALLEGRYLTLARDKVVKESTHDGNHGNNADVSWYYYRTPIARYDSKKRTLYLNHHGWYTVSTNIRFRNISAFFGYIDLPKQWQGDLAIKIKPTINIVDGTVKYAGRVL